MPFSNISREFIAVPDEYKGQLLYKWPDEHIRRFTRAIVDADELAIFIKQGEVLGTLAPGQHVLDADELPILGNVIDAASGGRAYDVELFFVGTRDYTGYKFGGSVDEVLDPMTNIAVELKVFGEYALNINSPALFITKLIGTVNLADPNEATEWVAQQALKAVRTRVVEQITKQGWPVLGLAAHTEEIEAITTEAANKMLAGYGLTITNFGNITIALDDDDKARLEAFTKDVAYTHLAGDSFSDYARGAALLGAGEGMGQGGASGATPLLVAGLATGAGIGQGVVGSSAAGSSAVADRSEAGLTYKECGAVAPGGALYCPKCGTTLAETCAACGHAFTHDDKFCPGCGKALLAACAACNATLAPGQEFCPHCGARTDAAGGGDTGAQDILVDSDTAPSSDASDAAS